jgi:transposase
MAPARLWSQPTTAACSLTLRAGAIHGIKLNGVEPLAWLTDVLERVVSGRTKAHELGRLLPWAWKAERLAAAVHA